MSVMSQFDLDVNHPGDIGIIKRCANCGRTEQKIGQPITTIVIDWRTDLLCDGCVARFTWKDWDFDPVLNIYWRR